MLKEVIKEALRGYKLNDIKNKEVKAFLKDRLKSFSSEGLINATLARGIMIDRLAKTLAGECGLSSENNLEYKVENYEGEKHLVVKAQKDNKVVEIDFNVHTKSQESEFLIYYDIMDDKGFPDNIQNFDNMDFESKYNIVTQFNVIYNAIVEKIVKFCKTGKRA